MSTTQRLMSDEDIDGMVGDLKKWPNVAHDNGDFELAISPFLTFYFDFEPERYLEASLALIDVHEDFETLAGRPYTIATHPRSERPHPYGSARLGDRRAWARKAKFDESFVFKATDEENHRSSPTTAAYYWRSSGIFFERDKELYYSYAQFYYRWQWWLDNAGERPKLIAFERKAGRNATSPNWTTRHGRRSSIGASASWTRPTP